MTLDALGEYYPGRGIEADIYEVIVFDRALTASEICTVEYCPYYKWFREKPILTVENNSFTVNEGEKLEFTVEGSDLDADNFRSLRQQIVITPATNTLSLSNSKKKRL